MTTFNGTSNNTYTLLKRIAWFIGLNLVWLLLAGLTVWLGWRSFTLSATGNIAEGKVVRLLEDGAAFDADFYPVVEFQADGKTYKIQSQNSYRWWNRYIRFPVGGKVGIRYEPANPENAEINSFWDIWNETIVLGLITILAAITVNVYLFLRWRSLRTVT